MDLLGGIDMSGGATQNTNQNSNAGGNDGNALDFFNSGGNDAFGGGQ